MALLIGVSCDPVVASPSVRLTNAHVDIRVIYDPAAARPLSLVTVNSDQGVALPADKVVLIAAEKSRLVLPDGTPFGAGGDPLYILPQSQDPELLYLGFSTEHLSAGVFQGRLSIALKKVEGPGNFFVWQATSFGDFRIAMNTADGITEMDRTSPLTGSHEHFNWGFSQPGIYHVTFQASGRRLGEGQDLVSDDTVFEFRVLPLPTEIETPSLVVLGLTASGELRLQLQGTGGAAYVVEQQQPGTAWECLREIGIPSDAQTTEFVVPTNQLVQWFRARRL